MSDSTTSNVLSGFASYLAEINMIERQIALNALQQTVSSQSSYIDYLVKQKLIDESQMAKAVSEYFGLPLCDVRSFNPELIPAEYMNIPLVKKQLALPVFKKNGLLYLAITDPTAEHLHDVKFLTGFDIRLLVVEANKLGQIIDEMQNSQILSEIGVLNGEVVDNITVDAYREEEGDISTYDVESAPVVNYVNRILLDAIEKNASDIHFEHYEDTYRIRFRQHGVLYSVATPPIRLANYLLARIKVMASMDITQHRMPQDGRFKLIISRKRAVDFRVNVCPTLFGEKVVLRILDAKHISQGIDQLGMDVAQQQSLLESMRRSQGMILVTGPTGSGKTVTLYSALSYLNSIEKNISTVEDPVEIPLLGVNQVNVNLKAGLTFSTALRAFLRQDPDIIMVGEIRDLETAEIAIKASQTGHLVLSTLHTNSAPETVSRLMSMGIAPYNLASSLTIVIAQRLVRTLCELCKQQVEIPADTLLKEGFAEEELGKYQLYGPVGCERCVHGYKGRIGIFEVMPVSSNMSQLIMQGSSSLAIIEQAKKEKIINLRESGLQKVKEGILSLAELDRVFR